MTTRFSWPKKCTCCGCTIPKRVWINLRLLGEMGRKDAPPDQRYELRNCDCGSTLMVPASSMQAAS